MSVLNTFFAPRRPNKDGGGFHFKCSIVGLNFALNEPKMPLKKALTIVYRPIKLLTRYHQRLGLHGQEQQDGPNGPQDGDQAAVGRVFCHFLIDIIVILLQLYSIKIWSHLDN